MSRTLSILIIGFVITMVLGALGAAALLLGQRAKYAGRDAYPGR